MSRESTQARTLCTRDRRIFGTLDFPRLAIPAASIFAFSRQFPGGFTPDAPEVRMESKLSLSLAYT